MSFQQLRLRELNSNRKIKMPQTKEKIDLFSTLQLNSSFQGQQSAQSPSKKNEYKQSVYTFFQEQQSSEQIFQNSQEINNLNPFPEIKIQQQQISEILLNLKVIHSSVVAILQAEKNIEQTNSKKKEQKTLQDSFQKPPSFQYIDQNNLKLASPTNVITIQQTEQNNEKNNTIIQTEQLKQDISRSVSLFEQLHNNKSATGIESNYNQTYYQNQLQESFLINEINQSKQIENEIKTQKFQTKTLK
ncbi:hypothetical protein ABPG72_000232 [Tetrahymena utriculariae]